MRIVRYNGGTDFYAGVTADPSKLKKDSLYEVQEIFESAWHTEFTLKGFVGRFNSVWFEDVAESGYPGTVLHPYRVVLPDTVA